MRALCRCGELFNVHATKFPHAVDCPACGDKLELDAQGRVHQLDGPLREFNVACSCGQAFHIHTAQFPREVHCHVCGKRFTVFDNGDLVSADTVDAADPTAFVSDVRGITTKSSDLHLGVEQKAVAEVRLIDLQWELERTQYLAIARYFYCSCSLTHVLLFILFLMVIVGAAVTTAHLSDMLMWISTAIRVSWYLFGILGLAMGYVVHEVRQYAKAEADWQTRRIVAFAKSGMPVDRIPPPVNSS